MKIQVQIEIVEVNYGWQDENFDDEVGLILPDVLAEFKDVELNDNFDPGNQDCFESINDYLLDEVHKVLVRHVAAEWQGWESITFFFDYTLKVKGGI